MNRAPLLITLLLITSVHALAADWPMWRADASRRGTSTAELPAKLYLQWTLELPKPDAAWPAEQEKLQFDRLYEPVLAGKRLFVPSMISDKLTAFDTDSGKELWRFYTNGPVRFSPAIWKDKIFIICDDGYLYCLGTADGSLVWKFRGGPSERRVLGNDRLISTWPARGGPVVYDDKIYFGAGIWPFMGIFLHALDAETGRVIWTNSGEGSSFQTQQHGSPAFSGIAPQGYLAANEDFLVVSGGRTMPAVYDRKTGAIKHYDVSARNMGTKGGGGYDVVLGENFYLNRNCAYRLDNGKFITKLDALLINDHSIICHDGDGLRGFQPRWENHKTKDRKGKVQSTIRLRKTWA
ncbi:MAG: PQQ-like beta-propeller repeat protein, partial [Planctomycetes bacterium]|nr:PQQ-like beta-propeller repeat protein [Planctomycetota bacterium]